MAIDLSRFIVRSDDEDIPILKEICRSLRKPLNYKIRDGKIVAKGGKRIPVEDVTRYAVKTRPGDSNSRPSDGTCIPVWDSAVDETYVGINLLPFIAYGIPMVVLLNEQLAGPFVEHGTLEVRMRNSDTQKVRTDVNPDRFSEIQFLIDNMLVNVNDMASQECLQCAAQAVDSIMNGSDILAAMLLSMVNENDYLSTCFVFVSDLIDSMSSDLGNFSKLISYKIGRGECAITNTERVCVTLTCMWVVDLVSTFCTGDIQFDMTGVREMLQGRFFEALGNDEVGIYIRTGVTMRMQHRKNGELISRNDCDNDYLFNTTFGSKMKHGLCKDMHVYNAELFNVAKSYFAMLKRCTEVISELKDSSTAKDKEISSLKSSLIQEQHRVDTSTKVVYAELEQIKDTNKHLIYDNQVLRDRLKVMSEELDVLKSSALAYYSDDSIEIDEESESITISDCAEFLSEYSILVLGGDAGFEDRLSKAGLNNVKVFYDTTRIPVGTSYDFYCIFTKYVSHKAVFFLQSHFDTQNQLFYFNGTNAEVFIKSAYDFVNKYFEV